MENEKDKPSSRSPRAWFYGLVLVLALLAAYQPVWHAGFIWDDDDHVTDNPCIVGPLGFAGIWTTSEARYYPLVLSTFWLEHALWGLNPLLFHLVNLLGQGACGIVLWRVLLILRIPGAWFGAALWTLHPVQVESVAWITELKNLQSGLFYLLSIFYFVKELRSREALGRKGWSYALSLFFAALAMLSKSSTVVLPLVLCLCAWWVQGRWRWRNLAKIAPYFIFAAGGAIMALESVARLGVVTATQAARSLPERLITAGDVFWFYLGKLAWPHPLIFIYPRWQIDATRALSYLPLLAMISVLFFFWRKRQTWGRPWFFAFAYFAVALLPVLCLVNHYFLIFSFVADHLQYLASMGPLSLAGAGLSRWADAAIPRNVGLRSALGAGLLTVLGAVDWQRADVYKSNEILWADTLAQNPSCWVAHINMAMILVDRGQLDDALGHYEKALEFNPDYAEGRYNLGAAYFKKGRIADAIAEYQKALALHPDFVLARTNLGWALIQSGKHEEGAAQYRQALEANPHYALAHYYLGLADLQKGQSDDALAEFRAAVKDDPTLYEAHDNLGLALLQKGKPDEAIQEYERALTINPASAEAHNNLGLALYQRHLMAAAAGEIKRALQLEPDMAEAHYNLGNVYLRSGDFGNAIDEFQTTLRLNPGYAEAHNNLAVALFSAGRYDDALVQFREFARLNPNDPQAQENLAKATEMARQKASGK